MVGLCLEYLASAAQGALPRELRVRMSASDLVQETLLECRRDFHRFAGTTQQELLAWMRQALRNNLEDAKRRHLLADKRRLGREVRLNLAGTDGSHRQPEPATDSTPSVAAMAGEETALLDEAVQSLPEHYRHVILFRHRDGLSFVEIAERIGRSPDAVRKTWLRAIHSLKLRLGQCNGSW